nr:hypothetical protein [Tanacetum cinerariifolium]
MLNTDSIISNHRVSSMTSSIPLKSKGLYFMNSEYEHSRAACTGLLVHVPELWLSLPFLVASRAANAALTPLFIIACSWALVTDVVVVDGVVIGVVPGFNLVVLLFGAIFFNHKKTQYPLYFNTIITQEK